MDSYFSGRLAVLMTRLKILLMKQWLLKFCCEILLKTNTFEMDELIEKNKQNKNTNFSKGKIGCGKDFCKLYILERTKIEGIKRKNQKNHHKFIN